jgi:hypothetical protein
MPYLLQCYAYGAWNLDVYKEDSRKDSFMLHATTTGVNPFRSWAAVSKQVFFTELTSGEISIDPTYRADIFRNSRKAAMTPATPSAELVHEQWDGMATSQVYCVYIVSFHRII